jgi:hypothetical protein
MGGAILHMMLLLLDWIYGQNFSIKMHNGFRQRRAAMETD